MLDSKALTKIQSTALIAITIVAAVGGSVAYMAWRANLPPPENIRIGVCVDLDVSAGIDTMNGVTLAVEQINAEGGILGRNITIVSEDEVSGSAGDITVGITALTKLITVDKADYVIVNSMSLTYQDICFDHKKILFSVSSANDENTQRVIDDYDKYKYYFRTSPTNASTISAGMLGDVLTVANYTGFKKVALLFHDTPSGRQVMAGLKDSLPSYGLDIVYSFLVPTTTTTDFTSYFAAIESTGAEILVPMIYGPGATATLVKEWYNRQSPCVIWGVMPLAADGSFWSLTEGKCDTISVIGSAVGTGYPLTNKTVPFAEAYVERWENAPGATGIGAYDTVRFILSDAIKRAGTTDTESVIRTLETGNVETTSARHFTFTSSHDVMVRTADDYQGLCMFQWQNGTQVLVMPEAIMKGAGDIYEYPDWPGPWSE